MGTLVQILCLVQSLLLAVVVVELTRQPVYPVVQVAGQVATQQHQVPLGIHLL
jgi:hypothetical protein